jgi:protein phosphatase
MEIVSKTHIGNIREENEDFIWVSCESKPHYMLVADGMGGAVAGEIASKIAAFSVRQYIEELSLKKLAAADLSAAVYYANEQVVKETEYNEKLKGMGTTLTLAYVDGCGISVAQVGDSCAYLFSSGKLNKITKDHTYVQKLIDNGVIEESQAEDNPYKNIITRVVGMNDLKVDTFDITWAEGDLLFLCSDGLTTYLPDDELAELFNSGSPIRDTADKMLSLALERGGRDNISFIIALNADLKEDMQC